ncbi:hypothetical protein D3C86_1620480 [compost metagenome]
MEPVIPHVEGLGGFEGGGYRGVRGGTEGEAARGAAYDPCPVTDHDAGGAISGIAEPAIGAPVDEVIARRQAMSDLERAWEVVEAIAPHHGRVLERVSIEGRGVALVGDVVDHPGRLVDRGRDDAVRAAIVVVHVQAIAK